MNPTLDTITSSFQDLQKKLATEGVTDSSGKQIATYNPTTNVLNSSVLNSPSQIQVPTPSKKTDLSGAVAGGNATVATNQANFDAQAAASLKAINDANNATTTPTTPTTPAVDTTGILESLKKQLGISTPSTTAKQDIYTSTYGVTPEQAKIDKQLAQEKVNQDNLAIQTASDKVKTSQAKLAGFNAELQAITDAANVASLQSEDRLAPMFAIRGEQAQTDRARAIKAMPFQAKVMGAQAEVLANQAEVAAAQGKAQLSQDLLKQATEHLGSLYQAKLEDNKNILAYNKDFQDKLWTYLTTKEKDQITANNQITSNNVTATNAFIQDVQNISTAAAQNPALAGKIAGLAASINKLDPKSATFKDDFAKARTELAKLQGQIPAKVEKATAITDVEFKRQLNKQLASPDFQKLSPEDKALYIQSQGGVPYDFGY